MSGTVTTAPPPGWYDDPGDPAAVRWWSGAEWTPHTSPKQPAAPAPTPQPEPPSGSAQTPGVWLLAFLPLMTLAISGIFLLIGFVAGVPILGLAAYPLMVGLAWLFGWRDTRELARRGYRPPSLLWMLLLPPLGYLIARGRMLRKQGGLTWPPELVYIGGIGVAVVANIALGLLQYPTVPQAGQTYYAGTFGESGTPTEDGVEAMLAAAMAPDGSFEVDCAVSGLPIVRGGDFSCLGADRVSAAQAILSGHLCDCGDVYFSFTPVAQAPVGSEASSGGLFAPATREVS